MGKNGYDPRAEESAARVHELARQPIASPAECAEEGEAAELVLLDELALRFQARGMAGREALQYARDALAVMAARDRAVVGALGCEGGAGAGRAAEEQRGALCRGLREIGVRIYEASKETRRMQAGALVLAAGSVHERFESARELAERTGTSHELAANAVEAWQEALGLPRTSGQKSERARQVYQDTNGKLGRQAA